MPRKLFVCAAALVVLAACIPAEPDDDVARTFDPEETVMGEIQQRGELIVGVEPDLLPLSKCTNVVRDSCNAEGFVVDLATEVAESLGVDISFVIGGTTELVGMPEAGRADITFPFVPVTGKDVQPRHQTDPYYVAHERLLVAEDSPVEQVSELTSERVCEAISPETGVPVAELNQFVTPITSSITGCARLYEAGEVEAVVGPDVALSGIVQSSGGKIVGDQLNTEGYSAFLESGAPAWIDYVDQVLEEAQQEGRWTSYFEEWIQPGTNETLDPPGMSLEEAAALYPEEV